jgi:hypothetical protein
MPKSALAKMDRISLYEALDRVLTKGAVVAGEVIISVADVDLLYLGLQLVITSMDSGRERPAGLVDLTGGGRGNSLGLGRSSAPGGCSTGTGKR